LTAYIKKSTVCCLLFLLMGCAHRSGDPPQAVNLTPDPSPAIEAPGIEQPEIAQSTALPAYDEFTAANDIAADGDVTSRDLSMNALASSSDAGDDTPFGTGISLQQGVQQQLDEALENCRSAQDSWQQGELETALDALDRAYSLILTVKPDDPVKLVQQKEDLRFLISKRILEIYASRNIVVNGNHNAIPREINANIQKEIDLFVKGPEKRFFIKSYKRSGKYRPMILAKLEAAGLPSELSWVPLIESGFKVKALSRARALGMWQFIPSTGYKFGLKRDQYIDERIDFEKATDAAIAYLKELHQIFGDWSTVLAAYNCGEGRVLKVIRTQNVNYLDDFWDLYGRLPIETARYVPRFLAALHIIENPVKYGLSDVEVDPPLSFETVTVQRRVHLKDMAAAIHIPLNTLKELNPELRHHVLPPTVYTLRVPVGQRDRLLAAIDHVPMSSPHQPAFAYHRVKRGENLSTIARRYHTSVKKIMWANNLRRSSYIVAGKKLKIPQRGTVVRRTQNTSIQKENWNRRHTVKSGDSLWTIAKRYKTTVSKIQQMNNLTTTRLIIDQKIKVPSSMRGTPSTPSGSGTYYVKRGDNPDRIARKHNMSLNHFLQINKLTSRSTIYPGQKVKIE